MLECLYGTAERAVRGASHGMFASLMGTGEVKWVWGGRGDQALRLVGRSAPVGRLQARACAPPLCAPSPRHGIRGVACPTRHEMSCWRGGAFTDRAPDGYLHVAWPARGAGRNGPFSLLFPPIPLPALSPRGGEPPPLNPLKLFHLKLMLAEKGGILSWPWHTTDL